MLTTTRDMILPTAITGSYPRPLWFEANLGGRSFKTMMGDSLFREQYLDAVAAVINAQEAAGLDIVTDGDSRFDLAVGGKSWFFYPIERLNGVTGHRDTSRGWMQRHGLRPGKILWEVQEAYQPGVVTEKLGRAPSNTPRSGRWRSGTATVRSSSARSAPPRSRACCGTSITTTTRPSSSICATS
jgi:5-methyltetrahydropteroyltriglutamate--homocysteine methyltransferase